MWVLGVSEWQLRGLEGTMKGEKRTSEVGKQSQRRHWKAGSWRTEGTIRKKGRDQQRRTGGEGRVFWSRWSAVPSLAQTLSQMCPSNCRHKTQPRRNILQGKTRPRGWVEGWGARGSQVLSKRLKDTVHTAQKEASDERGKTVCAGSAGNTISTSQLSNI